MADGWTIASCIISAAAFVLLVWELWGRGWLRSRRLFDPVEVDIVIPPRDIFEMDYLHQSDDWQRVRSLTLPPNRQVVIQFTLKPRFSFHHHRTVFNFEGGTDRPIPVDQTNLLYTDPQEMRLPGARNNHGGYELRVSSERVATANFDHGFIIETKGPGGYVAVVRIAAEHREREYKFPVTIL